MTGGQILDGYHLKILLKRNNQKKREKGIKEKDKTKKKKGKRKKKNIYIYIN